MVGSAIVRELQRQGYTNIITRTHKELDLTRQDAVEEFFAQEKPEYVFLAAAKVGGIVANQEALADFMYDNMTLEMNAIHSAWKNGCKKLEFLGSSCIYPRMAPQPMKENCLLTSELEKTNEAYALAKISGLKYCEFLNRQYGTDYISVMPTNLYGPNDNYHPTHSHVVPALIRRFHEAKEQNLPSVTCWGDGSPLREFLYVDDLANLCVFLMNNYSGNETVNAGTGKELTIKELTELVAKVVGYTGEIKWDTTKPNGTPRKKDLSVQVHPKTGDFEAGVADGSIQYIPDEVYTAFVERVKSQSVLFGETVNKNVAIVYSPLNGTGLKPVTRTLKEMGYTNITVVKEQEQPDGKFPTCPYPNPEIKEAMALGMEYAKKCNADLLLATDPDCDRVGIAVKNKAGEYELLTGNQTGMLLLDYVCSQRIKHGKMPADPVMVKTIVTMDMGEQIAAHYGLRTINVLTGFKFIGEQIGKLEQQGRADSYVFGFEESYGYLTGSYVRDKDGVDGAYMICEMFSYYATKGISLLDKLEELYKTYGYCLNTLHSYEFDGSAGFAKMQNIMQAFRGGIKEFGGRKVVKLLDYAPGLDGLPKSDVLKFLLEDNCSIVVRPSGTEPKLKTYISVSAENKEAAEKVEAEISKSAEAYLK